MTRFSSFVGLDVHKNSISVALARGQEPVQSLKRLPNAFPWLRRLLLKLGTRETIQVCYEAGPLGYGLVRRLREEGFAARWSLPRRRHGSAATE